MNRKSAWALLTLATTATVVVLCACVHAWDDYDPSGHALDDEGGSTPTGPHTSTPNPTGTVPLGPPPNCPTSGHGPALVGVGAFDAGYCIDKTEVTRDQYADFLDGGAPDARADASLPDPCGYKKDFRPSGLWPDAGPDAGQLPVTFVDWCDAEYFCRWAGKRVCAGIGGGEYSTDAVSNAVRSEWYNACSRGGERNYPYGNEYQAASCRGRDLTGVGAGPVPVGSLAACVGGVDGVFDLSGNVFEWDGACLINPGNPDTSKCAYRGGGYNNGEDALQCGGAVDSLAINSTLPTVGFRCCSDATK